jgi:hypothetical protein
MAKRVKRETKAMQEAQKFLVDVPPEYVFWCNDGKVFRRMKELGDALSVMTEETYGYHCNAEKKDFSNWVRDIIGDVKLAKELEEATSRSLAAWQVATRMSFLTKQLP